MHKQTQITQIRQLEVKTNQTSGAEMVMDETQNE